MHFLEIVKRLKNTITGIRGYTVVYLDRFSGMLECDLDLFVDDIDIPSHRAYLIKKDDKVMWDRKEKINLFKF